jgi:raffinose/stachyose/melibiose transport system substrate-binding protein
MPKLKKWATVLTLTLAVVLTAACGGGKSESSPSGNSESPAASSSSTAPESGGNEVVKLSLWMNWKKGSAYTGMYYDRVQSFIQEYPNIKLTIEEIPYVDYKVRLQTAAAGNMLPDIMQFISGGPLLETMAKSGALQPLRDEFVNEWKDKTIPAGMLKQFEVDGKQYGIPAESNYGSIVFYNKDLLAQVGFNEFPTQFNDLLALVDALKAKGVTPIVVGNVKGEILTNSFFSIMSDRVLGANAIPKLANGEYKLTDPEFITVLQKLKELADHEAFNEDANTIETIESVNRFIKGQAAIVIDGSWTISQIVEGKPSFEVGVANFPEIEGGKGSVTDMSSVTNQAVVINSKLEGQQLEAAETFIRYMFSEDLFKELVARSFPVTATNIEIPADANPIFKTMIDMSKNATNISPNFENTMSTQATTKMFSALQGLIMKGGLSPEQVAEDVQKTLK